jgi:hypothetical protein
MSVKYLNRARHNTSGAYTFWYSANRADPSMSTTGAPTPSSDYGDVVTVGKTFTSGILKEDLTSQVSGGGVTTFSTSQSYVSGSLRVFYNGQYQRQGDTFSEVNATTFSTSFPVEDESAIQVEYRPA